MSSLGQWATSFGGFGKNQFSIGTLCSPNLRWSTWFEDLDLIHLLWLSWFDELDMIKWISSSLIGIWSISFEHLYLIYLIESSVLDQLHWSTEFNTLILTFFLITSICLTRILWFYLIDYLIWWTWYHWIDFDWFGLTCLIWLISLTWFDMHALRHLIGWYRH